jgi:hypothetical protein
MTGEWTTLSHRADDFSCFLIDVVFSCQLTAADDVTALRCDKDGVAEYLQRMLL